MILKINDRIKIRTVDFFTNFELDLKYDSVASTFSFSFYFDPKNHDHAELACVSHFHEAIIEHNGETLITGYILANTFNSTPKKELVHIGGYSKAGVLEDCDISPDYFPLETNGLSLKEIAEKYIKPFKLNLVIDNDVNQESTVEFTAIQPSVDTPTDGSASPPTITQSFSLSEKISKKIDKANAKESQNIKSFLTDLATQRNVLLSHNNNGDLLFTEPKTNLKPILHFEAGVIGTTMSLSFNGQGLHSEIWVIRSPDSEGSQPEEYKIINPYVPIVYRPKVVVQTSGDDLSLQQLAQKSLSAELKNIKLTITTDRWEVDGKIIKPNNLITVKNPDLYLYNTTKWFIESIKFTGDSKKTIAVLTCVLPEVYSRNYPKNVFVDAHNNLPRF